MLAYGLPGDLCPFVPEGRGGYLAFLGRISPEKRVDRAIEIAQRAGIPLRIAAKVDPVDRPYFADCIEPLLSKPGVDYVGEISDEAKGEFLGNAAALLFPIDWPEPFGLVMIEAMSCGTPVIAWRRGSVPEVLDDPASGRMVDDVDGAVAAVHEVIGLDRRTVRKVFERRFTASIMASNYVNLYRRLCLAPVGDPALASEPGGLRPVSRGRGLPPAELLNDQARIVPGIALTFHTINK